MARSLLGAGALQHGGVTLGATLAASLLGEYLNRPYLGAAIAVACIVGFALREGLQATQKADDPSGTNYTGVFGKFNWTEVATPFVGGSLALMALPALKWVTS